MYKILMEIMEPEMQQRDQENIEKGFKEGTEKGFKEGIEKGLREGIQKTIDTLREFGHRDADIKAAIMDNFNISAGEVESYL